MKIGDYVRTKYGIAKIEEIKPDDKYKTIWYTVDKAQYHCFLVKQQDIIKTSPNIIDLIEAGDYVNGNKITSIRPADICGDEKLDYQHIYYGRLEEIFKEDIKSIVTKQQFESMEYRIGE